MVKKNPDAAIRGDEVKEDELPRGPDRSKQEVQDELDRQAKIVGNYDSDKVDGDPVQGGDIRP